MSATEAAAAIGRPRERFFMVLAFLLLALVVAGFAPTFLLRSLFGTTDYAPGTGGLPPHLIVHGVVLTGWFLLFAVQTSLIAAGHTPLHRRLGVVAVFLAVAVVAVSLITQAHFLPRVLAWANATGVGAQELDQGLRQRLVPPVVSGSWALVLFVLFVGAGLLYRQRAATHKRFMLFASLAILGPALSTLRPVGRLLASFLPEPLASGIVPLVLLAAIVWHDLATVRRIERATWWGLAGNAVAFAGTAAVVGSDAGLAYARWLASVLAG